MSITRLEEENRRLRECLKRALEYRPLPTDPLQVYIRERCPDVIEEWNEGRASIVALATKFDK